MMCLVVGILWYFRGLWCFCYQDSAAQDCSASNIVSHPRKPESPATVPCEPQISCSGKLNLIYGNRMQRHISWSFPPFYPWFFPHSLIFFMKMEPAHFLWKAGACLPGYKVSYSRSCHCIPDSFCCICFFWRCNIGDFNAFDITHCLGSRPQPQWFRNWILTGKI